MNNPQRHVLLALPVILLLTVGVYFPGLSGDYLFDDTTNLLDNKALDFDALTLENLRRAAFSTQSGVLRRPVSMLSFALNRHFFGIDPWSHKAINLAIHLLNGLLLFLLGRMLLHNYRRLHRPALADGVVHWLPLWLAALWLVHPLNLTSVLYIVQRMTSLSTLFMLAGLCLYVSGRQRILDGRPGIGRMLAGLAGGGLLAVLSKESGILLPLYMLAIEVALFRFRGRDGATSRPVLAFCVLLILLPGFAGLLHLALHPDSFINYGGREFTLGERLLTQPRVMLFYLHMILMPSVQALGIYHDDIAISHALLDPPATLFAIIALGALLLTGLLLVRRAPLAGLGILWFFAGHVLESSIFPLEMVHEHRNYLADFGILLALASLFTGLPAQRLAHPVFRLAPLLVLVLFAYTTWTRSTQWTNVVDHAVFEALHHPDSPRAVFAAGRVHARLALNGVSDSVAPAFADLERAARLDPTGIMPDVTLIKLGFLLNGTARDEWFESVLHKLASHPITPSDIVSLQELTDCAPETCRIDPDMMDRIYRTAMRTEHTHVMTLYAFYNINRLGRFERGLELFERAVELNPGYADHWKNLINLLMVMRRFDTAEQRLQQFRDLRLIDVQQEDYRLLQSEIDRLRTATALAADQHPGDSYE